MIKKNKKNYAWLQKKKNELYQQSIWSEIMREQSQLIYHDLATLTAPAPNEVNICSHTRFLSTEAFMRCVNSLGSIQ